MKVSSTRSTCLSLPPIVSVVIYCFKIIGLAPISIDYMTESPNFFHGSLKGFSCSKAGRAYNLILSIIVLIMAAIDFTELASTSYPNKSFITQAVDHVISVCVLCTSCFLIMYWAFRRKIATVILNGLLGIHCLLSGPRKQYFDKSTHRYLATHMAFNSFLWIFVAVSGISFLGSVRKVVLSYAPMIIIYLFVIEYSIVLRTLATIYHNLNRNLSDLRKFPTYIFRSSLLDNQLAILKSLHSIRTTLFKVSSDIADFFSFPILLAIFCLSITLVYNVYFTIIPIICPVRSQTWTIHIYVLISVIMPLYPLIFLSFNVTEATKEARLTRQVVNKLWSKAIEQQIKNELEEFSLQLIHEDVSFTAYGIFVLDFTLLQSIFATGVTYLVIIIQFTLSSNCDN